MPTVNAKPFDWADRLYKTVFKGKPNIFSAQDLNRYLDAIHSFQVTLGSAVGAIRHNWTITVSGITKTSDVINDELEIDFNWKLEADDGLLPTVVYYKGVQFQIPVSVIAAAPTQIFTLSGVNTFFPPAIYFVLVATKKTVTFDTASPVMHVSDAKEFSGVTGTSFPSELPAADNIIYGEERIEITTDPDSITLGADEEVICILATLRNVWNRGDSSSVVAEDKFEYRLMYNASTIEEINELLTHYSYGSTTPFEPTVLPSIKSNNGLIDFMHLFYEHYLQGQSVQDWRLATLENSLGGFTTKTQWYTVGVHLGTSFILGWDSVAADQTFTEFDTPQKNRLRFRKYGNGMVTLTGFAFGHILGANWDGYDKFTLFTLPSGYRPGQYDTELTTSEKHVHCSILGGSDVNSLIVPFGCEITPSGDVVIYKNETAFETQILWFNVEFWTI